MSIMEVNEMKKLLALLLSFVFVLSLAACGGKTTPADPDDPPATSQSGENTRNDNGDDNVGEAQSSQDSSTDESKDNATDNTGSATGLDELKGLVSKDIEDTFTALTAEYETLVTEIDTFNNENTNKIETYYAQILADTKALCIRICEYSVDYAKMILSSDRSNDDKYDDLDGLHDYIRFDVDVEIREGMGSFGIVNDIKDFYGGIIDDAYDDRPYDDDWHVVKSDLRHWKTDAWDDIHDTLSFSDADDFLSDMKHALSGDDVKKAEDTLDAFQDYIEKIKGKSTQDDSSDPQ